MTSETGDNNGNLGPTGEAFLKTNSLTDIKRLVQELAELGEDTKDISTLVTELEELYAREGALVSVEPCSA